MTTPSLLPRTQVIKATYAGDANFKPSTGKITQVVNGYTTTTEVASSLNPSLYGQPVTWAAMVMTSGTVAATGNVVFRWSRDGLNYTIGSAPLNANGVAMLARSNLNADPLGEPYPLVAVYSGDTLNLGSTSAVLPQHRSSNQDCRQHQFVGESIWLRAGGDVDGYHHLTYSHADRPCNLHSGKAGAGGQLRSCPGHIRQLFRFLRCP